MLAEWQAWAIASQQDRWRLVAICPGNTYGPPMDISPNSGAALQLHHQKLSRSAAVPSGLSGAGCSLPCSVPSCLQCTCVEHVTRHGVCMQALCRR